MSCMHANHPSHQSSFYCVVWIVSVHCVFCEPCSCKQHIFAVDELGQVFAECFSALVDSELKFAFPSHRSDSLYLLCIPVNEQREKSVIKGPVNYFQPYIITAALQGKKAATCLSWAGL